MGELQAPTYTPQAHQPPATPTPTPNLNASCNGATQEKPHQKSSIPKKTKYNILPHPSPQKSLEQDPPLIDTAAHGEQETRPVRRRDTDQKHGRSMRDAPISRGPALHRRAAPITAVDTRACFEDVSQTRG
ncbi:uncharacterized protein N7473_002188 [Penicillium subrubescens]|uniref:uncharacterized protein n=1 Tax=Penicillium subrubescens TaxID=1316194 RepID=UPI002545508F|nr:uncharacterized protein N7473_002188 [Penicillium subrubescens]KAJ5905272.1 hypothetical protein N7473_002188 [Penicillium subrubescens]